MSVVIKKNSEIEKELKVLQTQLKVLRTQLKENKQKELLLKNQIKECKDMQITLKFDNLRLSSSDNYEIKIFEMKKFLPEISFLKKELKNFINGQCNEYASIMKSIGESEFMNKIQLVKLLKLMNSKQGWSRFDINKYSIMMKEFLEPYKLNFKNKIITEWKEKWVPYFTRRTNSDVFNIIESYLI